ncbi:restriction endonuclease subunit S [Pseudoduganella rhizocola]|uniref:restriction endonuclease subunit S n=1 Tax=Pseudoduganella rhizocola TaxID=3382643 RepID=UPI0038B608AC
MTNWPRVPISELCQLIVDCVNKTAPCVEHETPYKMIRTTNIKNGRIDLSSCDFVSEETFEKWTKRATVKKGDVLLTREAPMGEVGKVNFNDNVFLGQRIVQYRTNPKKLDQNYLLYSFLSPDLQYQFKKHDGNGSTVSHIRVPDCLKFEIPLPELSEQKRIAAVLLALDKKIDLNRRINVELESLAKTVYDYWFVQFDFPDAQNRPYKTSGGAMNWNDSLGQEIPSGWGDDNISAIADILGGGTPRKENPEFWNGDIPFFTPTDASGDAFQLKTEDALTQTGLKNCSSRPFARGTIFITARGSVGKVTIAGRTMAMNQSCYALQPKDFKNFPYVFLHAKTLVHHLKVKASGSTFNSIVTNDIGWTRLISPNPELISKFCKFVTPIFERIEAAQKENIELSALRDWLLPLLMSGQVRVKDVGDAPITITSKKLMTEFESVCSLAA